VAARAWLTCASAAAILSFATSTCAFAVRAVAMAWSSRWRETSSFSNSA
jgi:hypothetical protein